MHKFIKKSIIFFTPLAVWGIVILLIDPFNYFNIFNIIPKKLKIDNARSINLLLYQSIEFNNSPNEYLIIGDSRTDILPRDKIELISGNYYGSLCNNAAKLNEIIDLVYMANEINKLKQVVIGINFNMFNEYGYADRVSDIKNILSNPLKYIYGRNTLQACYYILRSAFFEQDVISDPPMAKEQFWKWILEIKATHWYGRYKFPIKLLKDLKGLDTYCFENDITLTFVIMPHNREFHDRLVEFGLEEDEQKFKSSMGKLKATVVDYDYDNDITRFKRNFDDPIHYNSEIANLIVNEIWGNNLIIGKKL
jgi:hypothetical protein